MSSQTYKNLKAHGEAVFHVTDDVELLARSAVEEVTVDLKPAKALRGWIWEGACRAYELRVRSVNETLERASFETEVVRCEALRDFCGLSRAKHAVVEAAILATRLHLIPRNQILSKLDELRPLVEKTGDPADERAFRFLCAFIQSAPTLPPQKVRVRTGSRLHFGLIWPGESGPRRFGGAGLMVDEPALDVTVERSETFNVQGPLSQRAKLVASRIMGEPSPQLGIQISKAPREHSGLGTGTQLSMAIAQAISTLRGESHSASELALRAGRGLRSAIGVHGFAQGGFLIDGGRGPRETIAPLLTRIEVPSSWRLVLAAPEGYQGLSGRAEEASFREVERASAQSCAEALCHLLVLGVAPALMEQDIRAFGEALFEYGRRSGELFKKVQGGAFASPAIASLVGFIRSLGFSGAGQSSWGPTVHAVVASAEEGAYLAGRIRERFGLDSDRVLVSSPNNQGASTET